MMKILSLIIIASLFISAFTFFTARVVLYFALCSKGVQVAFGKAGLPFYLESLYHSAGPEIKTRGMVGLLFVIRISAILMILSAVGTLLSFLIEGS